MKASPFLLRSSFSGPSSTTGPLNSHPVRRASEFDITYPPRYSTLIGTSPLRTLPDPVASIHDDEAIAEIHDDETIAEIHDDETIPPLGPPAYSTEHQRSHSLERVAPRPSTVSHVQRSRSLFPVSQSRNNIHNHYYHISGSKAEPWATLKFDSHSSSNLDKQNVPHFTVGDLIRGVLELNLNTPQNINSISLSLRGRIIATSYEHGSHTFLDQPITSWDRNDGDPRTMFFTPETIIKKFEGKLSGQYAWPFSLAFPKEVTIRGQHQYLSKAYPTPRSFVESETNTSVQYDLVLRVTHGMLRADSKLNVEIKYVPDTIPDPCSSLFEAAYRANTTIPGLDEDPEGWFTLSRANMHGKLSFSDRNDRHAHLRCTLSLAKPLCYTRGSVIPCHLSIHSTNTGVLDTLANHKYIRVCLVRRIHLYEDPKQAYSRTQQVQNASGDKVPPGVIEKVETIKRAVWWLISSEEPDTRCLRGEIHLDRELQPSSQFLLFKVSYTIELYPFESCVFKCTNSGFNTDSVMRNSKAFMTHPVTIATQHRQDQVPVPVTILKPRPPKEKGFPPPEFLFYTVAPP